MKNKYLFVAVMLLAIMAAGVGLTELYVSYEKGGEGQQQFHVVTSFYPMYIAAENIIGDCKGVTLQNLSEPQTGCMHDYQLTAADMRVLSDADAFVINGGGIESFLSDVAAQYPKLAVVNACGRLQLAEDNAHASWDRLQLAEDNAHASWDRLQLVEDNAHASWDRLQLVEDNAHASWDRLQLAEDNAHAWMSIADYQVQVQTIADGLSELDTEHKQVYQDNCAAYQAKLETLLEKQQEIADRAASCSIAIFHEAFAYTAEEYGLTVAACMDLDEERQVSAGEVADIVAQIREHKVQLVLAEELYGKEMCETVKKETGVTVVYLDTCVRGGYEADSYLNAMGDNLKRMEQALNSL